MLGYQILVRGHPKRWHISQRWVEFWGGNWEEVVQEKLMQDVRINQAKIFYLERQQNMLTDPSSCCMTQQDCDAELANVLCTSHEECFEMYYRVKTRLEELTTLTRVVDEQPVNTHEEEIVVVVDVEEKQDEL